MNRLHLTPLGANMNEIRIGDKYVLFSYQTPVAFRQIDDYTVFVTQTKYSPTTTKHINKWAEMYKQVAVPQRVIDEVAR